MLCGKVKTPFKLSPDLCKTRIVNVGGILNPTNRAVNGFDMIPNEFMEEEV